jgi:hypothetical protein
MPIRGTFCGCCASATEALSSKVVSSKQINRDRDLNIVLVWLPCCSLLTAHGLLSPDHSISPRQHIGWNGQSNLLGGFEIDDQLELRRLLDRQIGRLGALQDFIDEGPERLAKSAKKIDPVGHQLAGSTSTNVSGIG